MNRLIELLKNDREHGSKDVARYFLVSLKDWCNQNITLSQEFPDFLNHVRASRPSMVIIQNIARRLEKCNSNGDSDLSTIIMNEVQTLLSEMKDADHRIYQNTKIFCQKWNIHSVLVHSRSSTVEYVLSLLGKSGLITSLICTESRPLNEGVAMAKALSKTIKTTVIVDALADQVMNTCDCVILGADAVDKSGNILNKIGSRLIALSAKDHGIPVICLAESMKTHPTLSVRELPAEFHSYSELGHVLNKEISVRNQYFEVVESGLISQIISDQNVSNS